MIGGRGAGRGRLRWRLTVAGGLAAGGVVSLCSSVLAHWRLI
ncbi:hypothetical protein [Streptomyces mashuensis]|nr:hypothetical protein [Streptomyces mashuensis]